ncbi:MAG: DUF4080 domain-containing protein [Burkholderiales bacterium]|nr:DUF4080 domain-containing protein [Burkholderiales bacterium]
MHPRILLATLNAKYIHAALGLRYLLANMARHGGEDVRAMTALREFTIQRPAQEVVDALLAALGPERGAVQVVGFGVYIWNITQTTEVVRLLKVQRPAIKVVLGGPEVSHEQDGMEIVHLADHVITGWGDVSFPKLCRALVFGPRPLMKVIAGEQPPLDQIALPYAEYSDADLAHRVLYVEASRGCPFKCEFCLSSLDKTAWAFDLDAFLAELATLYQRGARSFKFVDRTFNLKIDASVRVLQFFLDRMAADPSAHLQLHFEVVPDHLPERLKAMIAQFPAGVLQLEIGIQSFNPAVQQRIARRQDNATTAANVRWLVQHSQAHLHTDLIFGLPGETWQSFAQGFDALHALGPQEIQLGVLKRLRGTPLAQRSLPGQQAEYGMAYSFDPPYTVQHTDAVSAEEVHTFVRLARYWDLVANSGRFARTLELLLQGESAFAAFADFAQWLWGTSAATSGLTPEALVDALFDYLTAQRQLPAGAVRAALLADYVASGARSNPKALQGHLPERAAPAPSATAALRQRQDRHLALR